MYATGTLQSARPSDSLKPQMRAGYKRRRCWTLNTRSVRAEGRPTAARSWCCVLITANGSIVDNVIVRR